MKTILNLKKSIFFVTALAIMTSFTACSDDDDPKTPSVTDVYGSYKGKMSIASALNRSTGNENPGAIDVTAIVKNDTIHFDNFPIESIVVAIEGQENATTIIEKMDKVDFKVGYESKLNQAQDSIDLTLDPKPMEFTYKVGDGDNEEEKNVKVSIVIPENEKSAYSDKILRFNLVATEIIVNDEAVTTFDEFYYDFYLNKQ